MRKVHLLCPALIFCTLFATNAYADSPQQTIAPVPYKASVPTSSKDKHENTSEKTTAYVKNIQVKNGKLLISLDYIQCFFGEAAIKAYQQDHPQQQVECPPGYYIRNNSSKIRTLEISPKASFILQTNSMQNGNFHWDEAVNGDTFKKFVLSKGIPEQLPFHIEVTNGIVTKITEQYIP